MRVLIVDDDEIARDLLSEALIGAGYEVSAARDGREALEILRTGVFRLVISDWEMPEMNGLELCRRIRERHFSSYVYIILVTSRDGTDNVVEGLSAGADDFITKPFHPAELCVRVRAGVRLLSLESRNVTIFTLAKLAESAAQSGFDLLATSDHFQPWQASQGHSGEVGVTMGAVAGRIREAWMGTTVTCPILRYHPSVVAAEVAD